MFFLSFLQYESFRKEEEEKIKKEGQVITLESHYICPVKDCLAVASKN